jgi:KaiC/GvpD/RAD55 family RecA-like ATPase
MSSTRRAPADAPISFERYMSSPEYAELRGIPGTAVAAKAQLYSDARKRSLLFFLQSLSHKEGGLQRVARTLKRSADREEELTKFLIELCIDPKLLIESKSASLPPRYVRIIATLYKFRERSEARIRAAFVLTTIGKEIFETLDHALAIGKMVVIEGQSGSGKTTAAEAWCAQHQGEARFVSLSGITHKTGFFRKLAMTIGLAASKRKGSDIQVKVEDFFHKSRLMLVIDEAHYLWPRLQQRESSPVLVDWINTALVNHDVPVALICTDQFAKLKARVEKQTGWTSEQLEHRVKRYKKLTLVPTKNDLEAVAAKLLALRWNSRDQRWDAAGSPPNSDFVKMVVGYALTCKMRLPAIVATIDEARFQARKANRSYIVATDIRTALLDYQIPSDEALRNAFQSDRLSRGPATVQSGCATSLRQTCTSIAERARLSVSVSHLR